MQWWDSNSLSAGAEVESSTGSVSTNGASINSDAGRFADVMKFPETVLCNKCELAESYHCSYPLNATYLSTLQRCLLLRCLPTTHQRHSRSRQTF